MNFKKVVSIVESGYCLIFFITSLILSIYFITSKDKHVLYGYYGEMGLLLVIGACFNIIPKLISFFEHKKMKEITDKRVTDKEITVKEEVTVKEVTEELRFATGVGRCLTRISITLFYLLLVYFYKGYFNIPMSNLQLTFLWVLVIVQILLYLYPMKQWTTDDYNSKYKLIKNIPSFLFGGIVSLTFIASTYARSTSFRYMWLAVLLSFLFYIPILMYSEKHAKLFMIPKTVMYLWILYMGLGM